MLRGENGLPLFEIEALILPAGNLHGLVRPLHGPNEGEPVFAQLTRTEAEELDLAAGDIVWLRTAGGTALAA